ncbi:MAG: hypothetical protein ACRDPQ_00415 [Nocardioidaceae bacterium]
MTNHRRLNLLLFVVALATVAVVMAANSFMLGSSVDTGATAIEYGLIAA